MKKHLLLALTLSLSLLIGCTGQSENKTETEDRKIEGLEIPIPENWTDQSQLNLEENITRFDLSESEILKLLKTNEGNVPVAVYMKYDPNEFYGPIPTIQANLRPNYTESFSEFKKEMQASTIQASQYLSNYKIINPLEEVEVDGIKGVYFISQFDLPGQKGETWTIRSWTYAFPSGQFFYQINFSDTEDEMSEDVYMKILNQIKFRK